MKRPLVVFLTLSVIMAFPMVGWAAMENSSGAEASVQGTKSFSWNGISFRYSPGWNLNTQPLAIGGPIELKTFGHYEEGGIIPINGAVINIAISSFTTWSRKEPQIVDKNAGDLSINRREVSVAGQKAAEMTRTENPNNPRDHDVDITVYLPRGNRLYQISLMYSGQKYARSFRKAFDALLKSIQFQADQSVTWSAEIKIAGRNVKGKEDSILNTTE